MEVQECRVQGGGGWGGEGCSGEAAVGGSAPPGTYSPVHRHSVLQYRHSGLYTSLAVLGLAVLLKCK